MWLSVRSVPQQYNINYWTFERIFFLLLTINTKSFQYIKIVNFLKGVLHNSSDMAPITDIEIEKIKKFEMEEIGVSLNYFKCKQ